MSRKVAIMGNIEPYVPGENFIDYVERMEQFLLLNEIDERKKFHFSTCCCQDRDF